MTQISVPRRDSSRVNIITYSIIKLIAFKLKYIVQLITCIGLSALHSA
jgi:hypothetical protein